MNRVFVVVAIVVTLTGCAFQKSDADVLNESITSATRDNVVADVGRSSLSDQQKQRFTQGLIDDGGKANGKTVTQIIDDEASREAQEQQQTKAAQLQQEQEKEQQQQEQAQEAASLQTLAKAADVHLAYQSNAIVAAITNVSGKQIYCYVAQVKLSKGDNDDFATTATVLYKSREGLGPNATVTVEATNVRDQQNYLHTVPFESLGETISPQEVKFDLGNEIQAPGSMDNCIS